ncbi:MAG TPA: bifunctional sulfate adenylyltransferase/adenylylsulfate kinase [Pyrinomonadaceae bacterium]
MKDDSGTEILVEPYGGVLVDLLVPAEEREEAQARAGTLPRLKLTTRGICDLELLATGGFSPLRSFLKREDYRRVVGEMRLSGGELFPIPITCPVEPGPGIELDREIALADEHDNVLAVMRVEEVFERDLSEEAQAVYGTTDPRHPLVAEMYSWGRFNISGELRVLMLPRHFDFNELRLSPSEVRRRLAAKGVRDVVAFQTRNPLHRAHEEMTKLAAERIKGTLLLHPAVGMTKPGDIDHFTRVRSYKALVENYYDAERTLLALTPLAMRMAGPREALWHAIIRRNYGANHFIVGRDHASPGRDSQGKPFYPPYDAQELLQKHSPELGVTPLTFSEMLYLPDEDRYEEESRVPAGKASVAVSGTDVRTQYLDAGRPLPAWLTRPEVASILAQAHPPRERQGFCVWFTGLSGAGKTTTADILAIKLLEEGRRVTVLDGDVVRTHLSKGLGFSKEDRDTNVRRIGFVASEVVRHGGACVCAAVSPYRSTRNECRAMVGQERFIEVFVDTPIEVCEMRDTKGMYAQAREGKIKNFTGVDDVYEPPIDPELTITTTGLSAEENVARILSLLVERGFIRATTSQTEPIS